MLKYRNLIYGIIVIITFLLCPTELLAKNSAHNAAGIAFKRINEPKEQAFSILVPQGWQVEGGICRHNSFPSDRPVDPLETLCDLTIKSDAEGTVSYRILPDVVYAHVGLGGNYIPVGNDYHGIKIRSIISATDFLTDLFSKFHSDVNALKAMKIKRLPGEMKALDQGLEYANRLFERIGYSPVSHKSDAAGAVFDYMENGIRYREILMTGIINMPDELVWKNTRTLAFRAPSEQFEKWRPVLDIIRFSVRYNPKWVFKQCRGEQECADTVMKIHKETRRIQQQIIAKTKIDHEKIMSSNLLVLTEQEKFINPYTKGVEMDTAAYDCRWITSKGDLYYTNQKDEDPNRLFGSKGYRLSVVEKFRE